MDEPQPSKGSQKPPNWMNRQAKRAWEEIAPELNKLGLLTVLDRQSLARYCCAHARWMRAEQWLDENSDTYPLRDDKGRIKYVAQFPQVSISKNFANLANALGQDFGLSPSARVRLHAGPRDDGDKKDKYFFGE